MFGNLGMWEMLIILFIVLLLFGARRLPEIGGSLGKGIREFKGSVREIEHELKIPDDPKHKSTPPPSKEDEEPRRLTNGN